MAALLAATLLTVMLTAFLTALLTSGCTAAGRSGISAGRASGAQPGNGGIISGKVVDHNGPVKGAVVRIQTTPTAVRTDEKGRFLLRGLPEGESLPLTAWAPGYYITGGEDVAVGSENQEFRLERYPEEDHPGYQWLPSGFSPGEGEDQGCAECHSSAGSSLEIPLPVDEWRRDAHSGSAENPRFLSMYAGTAIGGGTGRPTEYVHQRDYGLIPVAPGGETADRGPGYKLDFPESRGNCGSCHVPIAALDDPYGVDPREVSGTAAEGVSCDFCHKLYEVKTDPRTGLPKPNRPGVLSMEFRRPGEGHQLFFGPLDDVAPGEDSYLPLQEQSRFCAACHHGVFWDVTVYNSYGEWLESSYSDPVNGQSCQECHMPNRGYQYFVPPEKGGLQRRPETLRSHLMTGATDRQLLRNALTMTVDCRRSSGNLEVTVRLLNDLTGHHVPTGTPLRHLILLVAARNETGKTLPLLAGPRLPEWAGTAERQLPGVEHCAGRPGTAYAKVLEELWTGVAPTGAYWKQTRILRDNRIPAFGEAVSSYRFGLPREGTVKLEVRLLYRRAFYDLMARKNWSSPDILMERYAETIALP
jgi:mono/diheme cytochrome c family protein